ncbi:CHASE3 domain-containing protein [Hahella aquimaris]|uniref:CHASE3 domain-containing protein n=1 Tax=Hahella sp. HNIBRBA332 TaxID=3015983 RepID=UPI00273C2B08|nr:CHASE3 domain-containing protein [Hahella sp. HNIBRBA332]WLQ16579.1 CHASE3 domain-containing protein [Hahella sp. HNIBRBA332]
MNWFEKLELRWKLILGFAIPIALILIIATTVYISLQQLLKTSQWVNHTYQAIDLGHRISASLVNMETGLRGYLIAGKEEFLEPFEKGKADFKEVIGEARNKVADNPQQVQRLDEIQRLQNEWQSRHVDVVMGYRREVSAGEAATRRFEELSARTLGKEKFDGFRAALSNVNDAFAQSDDFRGESLTKSLLLDMVNQETGQRGFLLSGVEASLEPYNQGIASFQENSQALNALIDNAYDREEAREHLKAIENYMKQWREEVASVGLRLKRQSTNSDVIAFVSQGSGKRIFDQSRQHIEALNQAFTRAGDLIAVEKLMELAKNMVDMETGYRGYLLTGLESSLEPFRVGQEQFAATSTSLYELVNRAYDPAFVREQLNNAVKLANEWRVAAAEPEIEARRDMNKVTRTLKDITNYIEKGVGKGLMDQMRSVRSDYSGAESALIEVRNEDQQSTASFTNSVTIVGALLALIIASLITYYLTRVILKQLGADPVQLNAVAERIAAGDLSMSLSSGNTVGVQRSMAKMKEKLTQVIEQELQSIIDRAKKGDLSERINLSDKDGFYGRLSNSINELLDVNEQVVTDTLNMFGAMAKGDLSHHIQTEYSGSFEKLKKDANLTVNKLTQVIERDIQGLVNKARHGDLADRIELKDKQGFFKDLSSSINELVNVNAQVLNDVSRVMSALSQGNLNQKITAEYQGVFAKLKDDANNTIDKLTEVVGKINEAASQVKTGSKEIAMGNSDLSARTEKQAASLEETASSMEELSQAVGLNADKAQKAADLAKNAQQAALRGGNVVDEAIQAMGGITEASDKIADIIGVIDDMAFQTNLLALNAAVEAARAGEQGRGFAVVAGEVRDLARRSASAAKEIKTLIVDSTKRVEDGSTQVNHSGETLRKIVDSVKDVVMVIEEIATSATEQSQGIEQVNLAVAQMDQMTQQNAALVEEASAASEAMSDQAAAMLSLMSFFKSNQLEAGTEATIRQDMQSQERPEPDKGSTNNAAKSTKASKKPKPARATSSSSAGESDWEEF